MKGVPLFPLNTVLFTEGLLNLRIFEPRYLDMVSESLRTDTGFCICMIRDGKEAGEPADCYEIGTYARIFNWDRLDNGMLGITVKGEHRIRISEVRVRSNGLLEGDIVLDDEAVIGISEPYRPFSELLYEIASRHELALADDTEKFEDACWVSQRLAELLPFDLPIKQSLLEMDDALRRLDYMRVVLEKINPDDLTVT